MTEPDFVVGETPAPEADAVKKATASALSTLQGSKPHDLVVIQAKHLSVLLAGANLWLEDQK